MLPCCRGEGAPLFQVRCGPASRTMGTMQAAKYKVKRRRLGGFLVLTTLIFALTVAVFSVVSNWYRKVKANILISCYIKY
jgi:hypothetical protein